jgi:hypothetical protein
MRCATTADDCQERGRKKRGDEARNGWGKRGRGRDQTAVPSTVGGNAPAHPGGNGHVEGGSVGHAGEGEDAVQMPLQETLRARGRGTGGATLEQMQSRHLSPSSSHQGHYFGARRNEHVPGEEGCCAGQNLRTQWQRREEEDRLTLHS